MVLESDRPVYVISIAAELAGMHPQTLRQYDRMGLVEPSRAPGRARRYSCLLYTSPSPRDRTRSRMPSSA